MSDIESDEDGRNSIVTARLVLRPPQAADGPAIAALTAASGGGRAADAETGDARAWMALARLTPGATVFSLVERRSGRYVGAGGIVPAAEATRRAEIRLWLGEAFAGGGLATEAAEALIDHAFAGDLETLWCVVRVTNGRAQRILEKCGFQYRETGMARSVSLKGAVPVARFELARRAWAGLKARSGPRQHVDGGDAAGNRAA